MDGEPFDFQNWHGQGLFPTGEECVYVITNGEWIDDDCSALYNFVCKKDESKNFFIERLLIKISVVKFS